MYHHALGFSATKSSLVYAVKRKGDGCVKGRDLAYFIT